MTEKGRKRLKIFLLTVLIISLLPWVLTLGDSIYLMFAGFTWGLFEASYTVYGGEAFVNVWAIWGALFLPVYIVTGILASVCIIVLLNMRKKDKGNTPVKETSDTEPKKITAPKWLKGTAKTVLGISLIPWLVTAAEGLYYTVSGISGFSETDYGLSAFILAWYYAFNTYLIVYVVSAVLTVICSGYLIITKNTDNNGSEESDEGHTKF